MQSALQEFLTLNVFAFMLSFMRIGTAIMIMPGIGDTYVSQRVRLHFAIALVFILYPFSLPYIPDPLPATTGMFIIILMEFIIGIFFGAIARIFVMALDTAGMAISVSAGFANAQMFNPALASQGSLVSAFLIITGIVLMFATGMHHLLIRGVFESYELFPIGALPDTGSMAQLIARAVSSAFTIGIKIAAPFLVMSLMIYVGMGVLSRLMPQIQVFMIALPLQILCGLIVLSTVLSATYLFWLSEFENAMVFFLRSTGS
ncbi:MAG: flagellar biosynthetic protein FliR [Alphaproteobacteria bacterium]